MKVTVTDPKCLPEKKNYYDAGLDLKNAEEIIKLAPYHEKTIHTGLRVAIPEGMVGLIFPRSSIGKKGLVLKNTVGVIDSHYRGEIMVMAKNVGEDQIVIDQYERFAQLVIVPIFLPDLEVVDQLEETTRGSGGFGSTGKK